MELFRHTDPDGDLIRLKAEHGDPDEDPVLFFQDRFGEGGGVRLDRYAMYRLAVALELRLYPKQEVTVPNPEEDN